MFILQSGESLITTLKGRYSYIFAFAKHSPLLIVAPSIEDARWPSRSGCTSPGASVARVQGLCSTEDKPKSEMSAFEDRNMCRTTSSISTVFRRREFSAALSLSLFSRHSFSRARAAQSYLYSEYCIKLLRVSESTHH